MRFGITASFPLGVYQGHFADGRPEPIPDAARLHAALLCAAAQGPRAVLAGDHLTPSEGDVAALVWLENNPPSGIRVPLHQPVSGSRRTAYRKEGVIVKEVGEVVDKVTARVHSDGYAIADSVGWSWDVVVPGDVVASLTALCADVPCLGEATSPVLLRVDDPEPTHRLDPAASAFDVSGRAMRIAAAGRTEALREAHLRANGKPPTVAQDRPSTSALPTPSPVPTDGLRDIRYQPVQLPHADSPWPEVMLLPIDAKIPPGDRVAWCVALHRALISRIGTGASAMVTGVYGPGTERPANRLAIQYLSDDLLRWCGHAQTAAFALLVPGGAAPDDIQDLTTALRGLQRIYRSKRSELRVSSEGLISVGSDEFWPDRPAGLIRTWTTHPVAIPETRPITTPNGRRWTLADAAMVSLGMVWRDDLAVERLRGPDLYRALWSAAAERGAVVHDISPLQSGNTRGYVHAVPDGLVVQPYRAVLTLGSLSGARTAIAIGQSRHLGGGLLVPTDVLPEMVPVPVGARR